MNTEKISALTSALDDAENSLSHLRAAIERETDELLAKVTAALRPWYGDSNEAAEAAQNTTCVSRLTEVASLLDGALVQVRRANKRVAKFTATESSE
jgi:hypothetical protein